MKGQMGMDQAPAVSTQDREAALFTMALEKTGSERESFLQAVAGNDPVLLSRLEALLGAHELEDGLLGGLPHLVENPAGILQEDALGQTIGRYKILEKLGEGGCGVVYVAEQTDPVHRRVALKEIKWGMDTRAVVSRFEAERQALALMDHPSIAKVFDGGSTQEGRPYFVMELVRGVRITDYCDENEVTTQQRLELFIQICHAVQHAHQKGVIHRDIKPSNILVTLVDGTPVPKIIDFGIAKATERRLTDATTCTQLHQFVGTPTYMSPEQAELTGMDVDTRSDVYSLGVLLYELLTGRTPFEARELMQAGLDQMRRMIREQDPVRPSTRLGTLPLPEQTAVARRRQSDPGQLIHLLRGDLDWIVMKCLEKDRNRRYQAANALAEDVTHHLRNEVVHARPPGRVYQLEKLVRRNAQVFWAAAAVVGALVIGFGLATWLFFQKQVEARIQAQTQARNREEVLQCLTEMLSEVGPSVAMGRDTTLLRDMLDKTAGKVIRDLSNQPEVQAELLNTLGDTFRAIGNRTNAASMHQRALSVRKAAGKELNTDVADSLFALGLDYLSTETCALAEVFLQDALNIRSNLLGPEHLKIAASLASLGQVRVLQAKELQAESFFREALEMQEKLAGIDSLEVAQGHKLLFHCVKRQGRWTEAEQLGRDGLNLYTRLLGSESSLEVAGVQSSLADVLYHLQRFKEAESLARTSWDTYSRAGAAEQIGAIETLVDLSRFLAAKGDLEGAEKAGGKALAISRRVYGNRYPTPWCLLNLGVALFEGGHLPEAEVAFRESVDQWEEQSQAASKEHLARSGLVSAMRHQHKIREINDLFRTGLAKQRSLPEEPARHREIDLLGNWAEFLRDAGRPAEAETLFGQALINALRAWPRDSRRWQWLAEGLLQVLARQGKADEIKQWGERFSNVAVPPDLGETALPFNEGDAYAYRGEWKLAKDRLQEAFEIDRTLACCHVRLGSILVFLGDVDGYRALCLQTSHVFESREDPEAACLALKTCLLTPRSEVNPLTLSNWARLQCGGAAISSRASRELCMALADYRSEKLADSLYRAETLVSSGKLSSQLQVQALCILALGQYRSEQTSDAETTLAKAVKLVGATLAPGETREMDQNWWEHLIAKILVREAQGVIKPGENALRLPREKSDDKGQSSDILKDEKRT